MLPIHSGKKSTITSRMADQVLATTLFPEEDTIIKDITDIDQFEKEKKKDPLSSQIWRMYTKAKDTLP
ncbi:uncharacterized protein B0P05DRAFT_566226, partial [Gilbertella persicaria]|uniref:uncharacterized protein n=1 Tax=Gilbertella persicaria TaxID=101096 RepID=UPI00221F373C